MSRGQSCNTTEIHHGPIQLVVHFHVRLYFGSLQLAKCAFWDAPCGGEDPIVEVGADGDQLCYCFFNLSFDGGGHDITRLGLWKG